MVRATFSPTAWVDVVASWYLAPGQERPTQYGCQATAEELATFAEQPVRLHVESIFFELDDCTEFRTEGRIIGVVLSQGLIIVNTYVANIDSDAARAEMREANDPKVSTALHKMARELNKYLVFGGDRNTTASNRDMDPNAKRYPKKSGNINSPYLFSIEPPYSLTYFDARFHMR